MIQGVNKHAEIAAQSKISPANDSANELLQSANSASGSARNAWLAYLVLNVYLLVTIAGVTHVDLLLNSTVTLPVVNVKIPLFSFFSVAPILLLLLHLGFLVQHAMLAHKYDHFSKAVSDWESHNSRMHPSRRHVNGYVFSQMTAGPKPPKLLGYLMRLMVFVTFSLLPVLVLLYFQIKFLPYHEVGVTHIHRVAIFLDLVLLFSVRPYITISYLRPKGSKLKIGSKDWSWELSYWSLSVSIVVCLTVLIFSLFIATVPQGCINPFEKQSESCFSLDKMAAKWAPRTIEFYNTTREVFALTAVLFEGKYNPDTGAAISRAYFDRNIVVTDTDLVPDKDDKFEEVSISLRDRDLRFAVLERSDLHRADLTGANLKWSSLWGAKLGKAMLSEVKLQGAYLIGADLQGADFRRADLRGADLSNARLQGANLRFAVLPGSSLRSAKLQGADLHSARLQGADLRNADLQGARLTSAELQGANLRGAKLQGADLRSVELQGADLIVAKLQGANLSFANLQGANLGFAKLQGANLDSAALQGANLRESSIWQTGPPAEIYLKLVDLAGAKISPLTDESRKYLQKTINEGADTVWGAELKRELEPLLTSEIKNWEDLEEGRTWNQLIARTINSDDLSDFLANLVCGDDPVGYIAKAITKRALSSVYSGSLDTFSRNVSKDNCLGAKTLDEETKTKLCKSASWSEAEIMKTFCAL